VEEWTVIGPEETKNRQPSKYPSIPNFGQVAK
jgi:hypothetical protein